MSRRRALPPEPQPRWGFAGYNQATKDALAAALPELPALLDATLGPPAPATARLARIWMVWRGEWQGEMIYYCQWGYRHYSPSAGGQPVITASSPAALMDAVARYFAGTGGFTTVEGHQVSLELTTTRELNALLRGKLDWLLTRSGDQLHRWCG